MKIKTDDGGTLTFELRPFLKQNNRDRRHGH